MPAASVALTSTLCEPSANATVVTVYSSESSSKVPSTAVAAVHVPVPTRYSTEIISVVASVDVPVSVGVLSVVGSGLNTVIVVSGFLVSTIMLSLTAAPIFPAISFAQT